MRQINLVEGKVVAPEGMKVGIVAARFNEIIVYIQIESNFSQFLIIQ